MKVVYDLREILFQGRGWERYGVELLTELQNHSSIELSYIVVNQKKAILHYPQLFSRNPKIIELPINPDPRKGNPTCDLVESADIYHSLTDYPEFLPNTTKLITSIHDLSFHLFPEYQRKEFVMHMRNNLIEVILRSSHIVCFSQTVKNQLLEFCKNQNLSKPSVTHIKHGISPLFLESELKQKNKNSILPQSYILSVGALDIDKNLSLVIEAFKENKFLRENFKLVITGLESSSQDTYDKLNIDENASFIYPLGFVPDSKLPEVYANAACFVSASIDEGFGVCPLEALACGTPVVCSDIPCHKEILGSAAIYFSVNDSKSCAEAILSSINLYSSKNNNIHSELINEFSWLSSAHETVNMYREVI